MKSDLGDSFGATRYIVIGAVVAILLSTCQRVFAWPPVLDRESAISKSIDGRRIERFTHTSRDTWGYKDQHRNYFFLVHPKEEPKDSTPLCIVLHSANRTGLDYLGYCFLNRKVDPNDNPSDYGEKIPADFYTLFLDSNNDEWWGKGIVAGDPTKYHMKPNPTERRVLDTIEWVATNYKIDRNRIYLTGVSMGGCGSLALALPHGDVFAAVRVWVPAGVGYASSRMGFLPQPAANASADENAAWLRRISASDMPSPPVIVDLSAGNDTWSSDQADLFRAAREGCLPLIAGWGPFGHTGSYSPAAQFPPCAAALAFPWMSVRKNEAYPVFTNASTDDRIPWPIVGDGAKQTGQRNAYFRWKSIEDSSERIAMRLWLECPETVRNAVKFHDKSVADVTLRRLQQFKVGANVSYQWKLLCNGNTIGSGTIKPDVAGLLTIPKVPIVASPCELQVTPQ